jgi:hypothetical protein
VDLGCSVLGLAPGIQARLHLRRMAGRFTVYMAMASHWSWYFLQPTFFQENKTDGGVGSAFGSIIHSFLCH